jgi:hypothetical protein
LRVHLIGCRHEELRATDIWSLSFLNSIQKYTSTVIELKYT